MHTERGEFIHFYLLLHYWTALQHKLVQGALFQQSY